MGCEDSVTMYQTAAQFESSANGSSFLSGADGHPEKSLHIYEPMGAILMQTTTLAKKIWY